MFRIIIFIFICGIGVWYFGSPSKSSKIAMEPRATEGVVRPLDGEKARPPKQSAPSAPVKEPELSPVTAVANSQVEAPSEPKGGKSGEDKAARIASLGFTRFAGRPSLGEGYRDRRGLVWGSIRKVEGATGFDDASSLKVTQAEAEELCAKDGNRLPSLQDYVGFSSDFGAKMATDPYTDRVTFNGGYSPLLESTGELVLPTLTYQRVWTSSLDPKDSNKGFVFNGYYGYYGAAERTWKTAFLCVYDPNPKKTGMK